MLNYQKIGTESIGLLVSNLYKYNPMLQLQDQIVGFWFDQCVLTFVKCYYWPAFLAGSADNIADLMKPQTYSICKV